MAIREYIGARYVPRFRGTYDATTIYEALDVVDNGMGTSYIAKVPTPAGTPLTNTTYWAIYGATSGAIINLQNQIDDMNDGSVPGSLQNQINDLSDLIDIHSMKILFVGDSYGAAANNFYNKCITYFGLTNATNLSVSGTGFKDGGFLSQVTNYSGDKDEVDMIVICGGLNDSDIDGTSALTPLQTAMSSFNSYVRTNYPNAKIVLSYIGNGIDNSVNIGVRTLSARKWGEWIYQIYSGQLGWTYFEMSSVLKVNKNLMDSDGVHPSAGGHVNLAAALGILLSGGSINPQYPSFSVGPTYGANWGCSDAINYYIHDGKLKFDNLVTIFKYSGATLNGGTRYDVVTFDSLYFNKKYSFIVNGRIDGITGGVNYHDTRLLVEFNGSTMSITPFEINSTGSGFENFSLSNGMVIIDLCEFEFMLCDMG